MASERKRKAVASMKSTVKRRALQDFSKLFELPTICQQTTPLISQPPSIKVPLYDYQLRSVYRMKEVEANPKIRDLGTFQEEFHCRGGLVADCVGMGKTAQLIALMLTDLEEKKVQTCCNLVVTPSHLCQQWKQEVVKFAGKQLKVLVISDIKKHFKVTRDDITSANVVILSLDYLTGSAYRTLWHWHHAVSKHPDGDVITLSELSDVKLRDICVSDLLCDVTGPMRCPMCCLMCKNFSAFSSHIRSYKHRSLEKSVVDFVMGKVRKNQWHSGDAVIPDNWLKEPGPMVSEGMKWGLCLLVVVDILLNNMIMGVLGDSLVLSQTLMCVS